MKEKILRIAEPIIRVLSFILPIIVSIFDSKKQQKQIADAVSNYLDNKGITLDNASSQ